MTVSFAKEVVREAGHNDSEYQKRFTYPRGRSGSFRARPPAREAATTSFRDHDVVRVRALADVCLDLGLGGVGVFGGHVDDLRRALGLALGPRPHPAHRLA